MTKAAFFEHLVEAWLTHFIVCPSEDLEHLKDLARHGPQNLWEFHGDELLKEIGEWLQEKSQLSDAQQTILDVLRSINFTPIKPHNPKKTDSKRSTFSDDAETSPDRSTPANPSVEKEKKSTISSRKQAETQLPASAPRHKRERRNETPPLPSDTPEIQAWKKLCRQVKMKPDVSSDDRGSEYILAIETQAPESLEIHTDPDHHSLHISGLVYPKTLKEQQQVLRRAQNLLASIPHWQRHQISEDDLILEACSGRYGVVDQSLRLPRDASLSKATKDIVDDGIVIRIPKVNLRPQHHQPLQSPYHRARPSPYGRSPYRSPYGSGYGGSSVPAGVPLFW